LAKHFGQLFRADLFVKRLGVAGLLGMFMLLSGGCGVTKPSVATPVTSSFYQQLKMHCGQKLTGVVLYPSGKEAPFQGMPIWLELVACSDKEIRMPIYINQKIYRTLVLSQDKTHYTLRHENKRPDGTQAEISMYGGQTTGKTDNYLLLFPADGYSRQLLGAELNYAWSLGFNSDKSTLSYMIENDGKLTLQIDFDFNQPVVIRN
jgi:hypothetical protein